MHINHKRDTQLPNLQLETVGIIVEIPPLVTPNYRTTLILQELTLIFNSKFRRELQDVQAGTQYQLCNKGKCFAINLKVQLAG